MSKVIMVANQKGGVGKTTTAVNLATILSAMHYKVLLIDLDPQTNATSSFGLNNKYSVYTWLTSNLNAKEVTTNYLNLIDVIISERDLAALEIELARQDNNKHLLKGKIEEIKNQYDFIFIDCPPSLGLLTINAFIASDEVLIPTQCEYFSLEGIGHIVKTINTIKSNFNPSLKILGFLLTMFDKRSSLSLQVANELKRYFGELVFANSIPRNIKIAEAPSHAKPIILYDVKSAGARAYMDMAKEFLEKIQIDKKMAA